MRAPETVLRFRQDYGVSTYRNDYRRVSKISIFDRDRYYCHAVSAKVMDVKYYFLLRVPEVLNRSYVFLFSNQYVWNRSEYGVLRHRVLYRSSTDLLSRLSFVNAHSYFKTIGIRGNGI